MDRYDIEIRRYDSGFINMEFSDNTPCILADAIKNLVMKFFQGGGEMTYAEIQGFEQKLLTRGYKRWNGCLYGKEDYDVSRAVRDAEGDIMYLIIFKFWDWKIYPSAIEDGDVDVVILPCIDGRADLELYNIGANDKCLDIDWVESIAKDYYDFITSRLK